VRRDPFEREVSRNALFPPPLAASETILAAFMLAPPSSRFASMRPFPACPPGRNLLSMLDPVVPGLITGLHHRLVFRAPSGSKFQLQEKARALVFLPMNL
jgi:hypothetical protein